MSHSTDPIEVKLCDPLQDATPIKRCLDYLRIEAARTGLPSAAHLIGVAAETVSDSITPWETSVERVNPNGASQLAASAGAAEQHTCPCNPKDRPRTAPKTSQTTAGRTRADPSP